MRRGKGAGKEEKEEGGSNIYFKVRGVEGVEQAVTLRLYTDFHHFRLHCDCDDEALAKRVLEAVAEELRPAVEQLERRLRLAAAEERLVWPKWHWNALELPTGVGWHTFLRLWKTCNVSLRVEEGGRELLRVEVLEARANEEAKFRLWYYKWRETRPDKPYVDVEIKSYHPKDGRIAFRGYLSANKAEGIYEEHLAEIAQLLRDKGIEGASLAAYGNQLHFTGAFRDSVLARLGIKPEIPPGEPLAVEYLGGLKFKAGDREVEFREEIVSGRYEFYAELMFPSREEAERFASSLKAVGVEARVVGTDAFGLVRLDSDAFFGLLAHTGAEPPGLTPLYRSDDLQVYASAEEGRMRFYFAVKHEGAWKAAEGLYDEGRNSIKLWRKERDVLEAIRSAVAKALEQLKVSEKLGRPAKVEEPKEKRDEGGNIKGHYIRLSDHHLKPFLEHAAETVKAKPAEVRLEGRRIVVKAGDVEAEVEFKLLKRGKAEFLMAQDVEQTLALYKSLRELGVPVEITPEGVRVSAEALWALVAAVERSPPSGLPAEVMPGVELLKVYSAGGMRIYAFRVSEEGVHYYFAVKAGQEWRATGGKLRGRQVEIYGEVAETLAKAINIIYSEMGVDRRVEVKQLKNDTPYIRLTNVDLELLGLKLP